MPPFASRPRAAADPAGGGHCRGDPGRTAAGGAAAGSPAAAVSHAVGRTEIGTFAIPLGRCKRLRFDPRVIISILDSTFNLRRNITATALSVLNTVFGLPAFRGAQEEIVMHVAGGGDCLVLMPTGGGKSLCYQLPALLRDGCGIVVSPLIALMRDQVAGLLDAGVNAAVLNSTLSFAEASEVERRLLAGDLDLLYVAPERLLTPRCLSLLGQANIALFAIDEAHCVSQWGHDFRPEYIGLSAIAEHFPAVPRIALTATADELTR